MPLIYQPGPTTVYKASHAAHVAVCCEKCGATYDYSHTLIGDSTINSQQAQEMLTRQIERLQADDYGPVAADKPCPQCGYLQSWMIESLRRKRGWMTGAAVAMATCFSAILIEALLIPENIRNDAVQGILLVFGLPVVLFFIARVVAMKTYRPNSQVAPRTNPPTVSL